MGRCVVIVGGFCFQQNAKSPYSVISHFIPLFCHRVTFIMQFSNLKNQHYITFNDLRMPFSNDNTVIENVKVNMKIVLEDTYLLPAKSFVTFKVSINTKKIFK